MGFGGTVIRFFRWFRRASARRATQSGGGSRYKTSERLNLFWPIYRVIRAGWLDAGNASRVTFDVIVDLNELLDLQEQAERDAQARLEEMREARR